MSTLPPVTGPRELLMRAMTAMHSDSDVDRRIAMLLIDGSVELTMRAYLELPPQATQNQLGRRRLAEIEDSFLGLLDALEKHAEHKLGGLDLGEIEWLHRTRVRTYHEGNGVDLPYEALEAYCMLAQLLYRKLFGADLVLKDPGGPHPLGAFLDLWAQIDDALLEAMGRQEALPSMMQPSQLIREYAGGGMITPQLVAEFDDLRNLRHRAIHGEPGLIDEPKIERLRQLQRELRKTI